MDGPIVLVDSLDTKNREVSTKIEKSKQYWHEIDKNCQKIDMAGLDGFKIWYWHVETEAKRTVYEVEKQ